MGGQLPFEAQARETNAAMASAGKAIIGDRPSKWRGHMQGQRRGINPQGFEHENRGRRDPGGWSVD